MLGHDLSYLLEVLNVGDGETEHQADERLKAEAKELGVEIDIQHDGPDMSTQPVKVPWMEYNRRSESIDSRASQSTGFMSTFSDASKDTGRFDDQSHRSRASMSFRDYDLFVSKGVPTGRHSISFSPATTPSHSTFSLPLSQPPSPDSLPKKHLRRIRGLGKLKLRRSDSLVSLADGCPHCPQDWQSQRRATHKLPCGHRLCTQALRNTIKVATDSIKGAVPCCCGKPIPGNLVEHVMTQEEQNALLVKLEQWDEVVSIAPSTRSFRRELISQARPGGLSIRSSAASEESHEELSPRTLEAVQNAMAREDYKLLRTGQSDQRDRFVAWTEKQRTELQAKHEQLRGEVKTRHEVDMEEQQESHASDIADAEDKQVKAESDVREMQAQARRDSETALKHMEAYCAGTLSHGEPHNRIVTEQDRAELEKAKRHREQMESRQENAINVLRGEQDRRMRLRDRRHEREVQDMKRSQRKQELEMERSFSRESAMVEGDVLEKRRKMRWRWDLQVAMLAKKIEAETGVSLMSARLPTAEWNAPPSTTSDSTATQTEVKSLLTGIAMHGNGAAQLREFKIAGG